MIQQANVYQFQRLAQSMSQRNISLARFGNTAWMVVYGDDGGRVANECDTHDLTRMNNRTIDRAEKQLFKSDHAMTRVEQQTPKNLPAAIAQSSTQILARGTR